MKEGEFYEKFKDDFFKDLSMIKKLADCIKETCIPIICICDDRYSQNIKPILNYCVDLH